MENTSEALKKAIDKVGVKEVAHHLGMSPQTVINGGAKLYHLAGG